MLFSHTTTLPLVYASTSGNVEAVAEEVQRILATLEVKVELHRAEQTTGEIFSTSSHFILATSTWEHGALNPFFGSLYEEMNTLDFSGKSVACIGLGDRRYEPVLFCEGIEIVRRRWLEKGGTELIEPLKIQGEPYGVMQSVVEPWTRKLATVLIPTNT